MTNLRVAHLKKPVPCLSRASVREDELESRGEKVAYHRHCGRSAESLWRESPKRPCARARPRRFQGVIPEDPDSIARSKRSS